MVLSDTCTGTMLHKVISNLRHTYFEGINGLDLYMVSLVRQLEIVSEFSNMHNIIWLKEKRKQ